MPTAGNNANAAAAATAVVVDSPGALAGLTGSRPKAILGFFAPWQRGSEGLMASVAAELGREGLLAVSGSGEGGDVAFGALDVAAQEELAFAEDVALLPCFAFYRNGRRLRVLTEPDPDKALQACRAFAVSMDEEEVEGDGEGNGDGVGGGNGGKRPPRRLALVDRIERGKPLLLFVAGDRSKVGKSSVCLGLMGSLLRVGFEPQDLAYIKPATQCESPQLVTKWCDAHGVANRGVGPVVFYKGFTREFLKGNVGSSADLLRDAREAVEQIGRGKKLVMVDGVGYPAVGSICGVSNADLAQALGPKVPILIVGRPGVGDAVDSFNLNATFFRARGLRVLGGVFNRLPVEGFYSLEACKEAVSQYFARFQPETIPYGFLPELPELVAVREEIDAEHATQAEIEAAKEVQRMATASLLIDTFTEHVDLAKLLQDAYDYSTSTAAAAPAPYTPLVAAPPPALLPPTRHPPPTPAPAPAAACAFVPGGSRKRKTREEIEADARAQGAKKGG